MNRKRRTVISLVLSLILLLSILPLQSFATIPNPFEDISSNDYYYDAVIWAYEEGITTGTTARKFAPSATCTRGQVVTFLWRSMGEPEPSSFDNPFEDVKESDYYFKAILWAIEKGITIGTSAKRFSPNTICSNAHILTFIWRAIGEPDKTESGEWYSDAVKWADSDGLITGTFTGSFDPSGECPRANVVTYLYRYFLAHVLTVYVSTTGNDETADGSAINPFGTISAARDSVRKINKNKYTAIRIKIESGTYTLSEPLVLSAEDSGTVSCPITYLGDSGTIISGGVTITYDKFAKAVGKTTEYFPETVRDSIVMVDLKQFGFSSDPEELKKMVFISYDGARAPFYVDGMEQTVARFPNSSYVYTDYGCVKNSSEGTATISFSARYSDEIVMWHSLSNIYTVARYASLSQSDNSAVTDFDISEATMTVPYSSSEEIQTGMPFYWYNIPEALDEPGEYYIDENAILYYYPVNNFRGARFSIPVIDNDLIKLNNTSYVTFSNILFESGKASGITGTGNHLTVTNCVIRSLGGDGISLSGNTMMIKENEIYSVGKNAVVLSGGDEKTLLNADNVIYNNRMHDWSTDSVAGSYAVLVEGCGTTVSHNDISDSSGRAISYTGTYHLIEYNKISSTCSFVGGLGTIYSTDSWAYGTVIRFNYIKKVGFARDNIIDPSGVCGIMAGAGHSGLSVYGNIIENTTGCGICIQGGRDLNVYGNLFIRCSYALAYIDSYYVSALDNKEGNRIAANSWQVSNQKWRSAFPGIVKLTFLTTGNYDSVIKDPNFNAAPKSNIKNNIYFLDTAVAASKTEAYSIDKYALDFSSIETPTTENGKLTIYNSGDTTQDVKSILKQSEKVLAITSEQYLKIGTVTD